MQGIYKITNLNNESYIGQSTDIMKRFYQHKISNKKTKLGNSLNKYGIENHSFKILELCEYDSMDKREIFFINLYNSFNNGLNSRVGSVKNKCDYDVSKELRNEFYDILNN